jgi:hypothetical protein
MKKMRSAIVLLLCCVLGACAVCDRHRTACAVAIGVAAACLALSADDGGKKDGNGRNIVILPPNCSAGACR